MRSIRRSLVFAACLTLVATTLALAQQRGSISGKVVDPDGRTVPGATVTVTNTTTGFTRTVVTAGTGAYAVPSLDPGTYDIRVTLEGFAELRRPALALTAGSELILDFTMRLAGVEEAITVTGAAPLVERSSNTVGGTLSSQEIDDVPANFRHIGALTQLVPGMTPNPAQSSFEGGQVVANGTPAQSNLYLLDGMYNNDDRLGGSQGTQVRVVLDNIEEYQVLGNQYDAEYGGGAGAIINMVTRGGSNRFSGRAYTYFRDDTFNARNSFLPSNVPKPDERTSQSGIAVGGPIVKDRVHFYFTFERDIEDLAGLKLFPPEAAPLAQDFVGTFSVRANNYFGRGDVQLNDRNFVNARWVLETAPTRGEGFNTSTETIDAQNWESDWDQLFNITYTSVVTDRTSAVMRFGRIGEQLNTGAQAFFNDDVSWRGFDGRDPFTLGQRNVHPDVITGRGGSGGWTRIRTYTADGSVNYFLPDWGGEHTFKVGAGWSYNAAPGRGSPDTGTFDFATNRPYDPNNPATYPRELSIRLGPPDSNYEVSEYDHRVNLFVQDKWRPTDRLTLNLGLRYDYQKAIPGAKNAWGPRGGIAWDIFGNGQTVVRGGVGRFFSYMPISVGVNLQTNAVLTRYPVLTITPANDTCGCVLRPDMITDSAGNPGVAVLSQAGIDYLELRRDAILAGLTFSADNVRVDDPNREMPYTDSWSVGVAHQLGAAMAVTADYVANVGRNQNGVIDINEPVNGVRPGVDVFDPTGILIPAEARNVPFRRVLQNQSNPAFDADYQSLQIGLQRRMANRWSGRLAYTLQKANYVGLGNPDTKRVWLDNDIRADYGLFANNRTNVLAMSGTVNPWRTLSISAVVSAISGQPINETTGVDGNRDGDRTDRPIRGVDDLAFPIQSDLDAQGRAVINGLEGPGSFLLDMSFRYQIPFGDVRSLDLFFDVFNLTNRENLISPTGNRSSSNFMVSTGSQFARQSQFGVRFRF
jgi:outer membrane receptor protein involved in Fe transport